MNLYFRLILVLLKSLFTKKIAALAPSEINFRVLPFDCDLNLHLTNSRYASFLDLGRLYYIFQLKITRKILKQKWTPVLASSETTFIRQVKPFQKVTLRTQLLAWDEKYQYFYHRFTVNNQIVATTLAKTAAYKNGTAVPSDSIVRLSEENISSPPLPETIKLFRELSVSKRRLHG